MFSTAQRAKEIGAFTSMLRYSDASVEDPHPHDTENESMAGRMWVVSPNKPARVCSPSQRPEAAPAHLASLRDEVQEQMEVLLWQLHHRLQQHGSQQSDVDGIRVKIVQPQERQARLQVVRAIRHLRYQAAALQPVERQAKSSMAAAEPGWNCTWRLTWCERSLSRSGLYLRYQRCVPDSSSPAHGVSTCSAYGGRGR